MGNVLINPFGERFSVVQSIINALYWSLTKSSQGSIDDMLAPNVFEEAPLNLMILQVKSSMTGHISKKKASKTSFCLCFSPPKHAFSKSFYILTYKKNLCSGVPSKWVISRTLMFLLMFDVLFNLHKVCLLVFAFV